MRAGASLSTWPSSPRKRLTAWKVTWPKGLIPMPDAERDQFRHDDAKMLTRWVCCNPVT